jgi:hypothetical protein
MPNVESVFRIVDMDKQFKRGFEDHGRISRAFLAVFGEVPEIPSVATVLV